MENINIGNLSFILSIFRFPFTITEMTLDEKLKNLPTAPGVYIHKNEAGKIIYIGKAKNLKNRVRSYFQSLAQPRPQDARTRPAHRRFRVYRR